MFTSPDSWCMAVLFAQDIGVPADAWPEILKFGFGGLMVAAFLWALFTGRIVPKATLDASERHSDYVEADNIRVAAQRDKLLDTYEQDVLPLLILLNREIVPALQAAAEAVKANSADVQASAANIAQLQSAWNDAKDELRRLTEAMGEKG